MAKEMRAKSRSIPLFLLGLSICVIPVLYSAIRMDLANSMNRDLRSALHERFPDVVTTVGTSKDPPCLIVRVRAVHDSDARTAIEAFIRTFKERRIFRYGVWLYFDDAADNPAEMPTIKL